MALEAQFAELVVRSPLGRRESAGASHRNLQQTFHYSIPSRFHNRILPGHLVWVPFGARELPGIVLSVSGSSPVDETRDILELIDPRPVLTPYQLELMRWISEYYLASLPSAAWAMFPPGISWRAEVKVYLADAGAAAISVSASGSEKPPRSDERAMLERIRQHGPMPLSQIRRESGTNRWRSIIDGLERKGWVRKQHEVLGPQVKPKTEAVVQLRQLPTENDLATLSRAHKQRAVLEYLREQAVEQNAALPITLAVSTVCQRVGVTRCVIDRLIARGLLVLAEREVRRDPLAGREFVTTEPPKFTLDQEIAWQRIREALRSARSQAFLLHGVTGSGKTEIYLRALARVLREGGQGIVLVPEIALTPQTIRRFAARFPGRLAILHSRLSAGERYDEWRRIREGLADVVVGPQSAIFAPLPRLRLIVVDEEHEWSYKRQEMPRYHTRDVAVRLGELAGAVVILGSATPDVTSYHRAERGEYALLELPQRIMGHQRSIEQQRKRFHITDSTERVQALGPGYDDARFMELPPVEVVDLRAELRAGNRSAFSRALKQAMEVALAAGEQVILFLNRRGAATFVMCRDCGYVVKCVGCDVPLTYHMNGDVLLCHRCSFECAAPRECPDCASKRIKFFGIGTQKVEQMVRELFPRARVLRWDRDVTGSKGAHEQILTKFVNREADVLIGTQMIAKGLDLPLVTLVGVVTADTALRLPDFRSSERTFQLLTQVAGRAGRSILGGKVIVQTYAPQHFCIQAASRHDYAAFYEQELEFRRQQGYPPFQRLVTLLFAHRSAQTSKEQAERMRRVLSTAMSRLGVRNVDMMGPVPCFFARIRGRYRWQIVLRGPDPTALLREVDLPLGWRVNVDPISLL